MRSRAREGTCLDELIELAVPVCQHAQQLITRRGPGRRPAFADWQMAVLIMVAIAKRKKSKSAQYRFLSEHWRLLVPTLGLSRWPTRSTYFQRYRAAHRLFARAIAWHGQQAVRYHWTDAEIVAVDKSLIAACGPVESRRRHRRGVDSEAGWGVSEHDGWVFGYGYEVVVACGKEGVLWPILASADRANRGESITFRQKIGLLPRQTRYVLADRGYDADDTCEAIEWPDREHHSGRHFVCPTIQRYNARRPRRQAWKESRERKRRRAHRERRKRFLQTKKGQELYALRSKTVEPFNAWFKQLFELQDRTWHRGLANNQTLLSAAILIYQILLRINRKRNHANGQIKWILDSL